MTTLLERFRETAQPGVRQGAQNWTSRLRDRFLVCNRTDCSRSRRAWNRLSHGAASLHLNGLQYCFPFCFQQELSRRFQDAEFNRDPKPRPPHRVPLGLIMLSRGDLDSTQLREALQAQREGGAGRIGEWIQKLGYAGEDQVTSALATQWACPVLPRLPARAADCGLPLGLLQRFHMVPAHFARAAGVLHVASSGDIEYPVSVAIEQMLDCKTAPCLATSGAVRAILSRMEEEDQQQEKIFDGLRGPEDMARITASYATRLGATAVRIVLCGGYSWIRIESRRDFTNLLFANRPGAATSRKEFPAKTAG